MKSKLYLKHILIVVIFLSGNIFAQWYQQSSGTTANLQSVFFIDENIGWICGDSGKIIKTTNGGLDWLEQNSYTTDVLKEIHFVDENNGWAYSSFLILGTTDGGTTWVLQDTLSTIVGLQFVDENTGWLIYQRIDLVSFINKTTDGGTSWMVQLQSPDGYYEAMFFLDENYGWITTFFDGEVLKTTNGGNNWTQHSANLSGNPMCIRFVDEMTGWVSHNTLGSYTISKSTDGGVNWFPQIEESFEFIYSISAVSSDIVYAAGFDFSYDGFILKTTNGGTDWAEQYREEGELFFVNDTLGWTVGNDGKIFITENGGVTSLNDRPYNPGKFVLDQNFPNPFNPVTTINYSVPRTSNVSLILYDVIGREIKTLVNGEKLPGHYTVSLDGSNLSTGVYFYVMKAGNFVDSKKFVLLK